MPDCTPEHNKEIEAFIAGYKKFRAHYFSKDKKNPLYARLVQDGQNPKTMIITCSDARVDPSIILDVLPGELFVVRNVANLVPPYDNDPKHHGTSAALEFGVRFLHVHHIIILAHSHCGGIRALLETSDVKENDFISSWMNIAQAAKEKVLRHYQHLPLEQQAAYCEEASLLISLKNLRTFPWIEEKVQANQLFLHAWRFDLANGMIKRFNAALDQFEDL